MRSELCAEWLPKRTPGLGLAAGVKPVTAGLEKAKQHLPSGSPVEAWDVLSKGGLFPGKGVPAIMGAARAGVGAWVTHHQPVQQRGTMPRAVVDVTVPAPSKYFQLVLLCQLEIPTHPPWEDTQPQVPAPCPLDPP